MKLRYARIAITAAAIAAILAGCAAPLKFDASADPLAVLQRGSLAYARLGGAAAREIVPSILPAAESKALAPLLARTRIVALGLGSMASVEGTGAPSFQACLVGDYPFRTASLSLGSDPGWKREKAGYFNAGLGLRAALPGPGLALASSGSLEPLLAAAKAPGASPIPPRLQELASREVALWIPEPFSGLVAALLGEAMDVPARGLLISASPTAGGNYDTTVVFLMEDADSARIYRTALKLAWYGIARSLLGDEADAALSVPFVLDGDLYVARGVSLPATRIASVIAPLL